jgi:hypothetical protein
MEYERQYSFDFSTYMYLTDNILVQGQTSLYHQENEFRALQSACMVQQLNVTGFILISF